MALINRISQLFKADFHAVLDQIEEPEQLLRQAIRDMEDDLLATEQRIAGAVHEQETLVARQAELEDGLGDIESELDLCFASQKDDLARGLVRRKLEVSRLLKQLMTRLSSNEKLLNDQRTQLDDNRATLDGLRQKADLFAARAPANVGGDTGGYDSAGMARELLVNDDEVEIAFLREKNVRSTS